MSERQSIREYLRISVENGSQEAEEALEWHERHLKSIKRKQNARKRVRKRARASRKKNR